MAIDLIASRFPVLCQTILLLFPIEVCLETFRDISLREIKSFVPRKTGLFQFLLTDIEGTSSQHFGAS